MTDLSPAAQAVLNAYRTLYAETLRPGPFVDNWQEVCAAAALRAAAKPFHWTWNAEMCHKHLVAIADELETL